MKVIQKFSLISNRLQQISAKSLAFPVDEKKLQPLKNAIDLSVLVPNFFANRTSIECFELQDQYKTFSEDKKFNSVTNSFTQLRIPLKSNEKLKQQFTKLCTKFIRIGRLLEVLDVIVGLVAYKHAYTDFNSRLITIATLGVYDFLFFQREIDNSNDLTINSYVTFVGKSSIEINSDIYSDKELSATVTFVMVSRNAQNYTAAVPVPQLVEESDPNLRELCIIRQGLGSNNQQKRIKDSRLSLEPPNQEESRLLHGLMLKHHQGVRMASTRIEKNTLMHTQDRNLHGKAFGGNIMKEILELGWLVGYKHAVGGLVNIIHIFDVTFLAPINIGSVINYTAQLCYVEDKFMIIQIQVDVHNYENGQLSLKKTTEVYLAMEAADPIKQVIPETYLDGMHYLHGQRLLSKLQ